MAKIINIENEIVSIGTDDGGIKEVRISDLNFVPAVSDEVDIFETETKTIVSKKVKEEKAEHNGGININVANTQNAAQPVYVANGTKAVNKVVYCLLTLFLGSIGVHKFYAGKTGTGILYLVFCWTGVPIFLALIDLIVALCKKSDNNGMILI